MYPSIAHQADDMEDDRDKGAVSQGDPTSILLPSARFLQARKFLYDPSPTYTRQEHRKNMSSLLNESRREFQVERMILFSDAVFAIAITLLVIEIKIPEIHTPQISEGEVLHELVGLIPRFVGFLISFFLIGMYWTRHHTLFGYVINYTPKLLWLNLLFLLSIVLMPLSTSVFGEFSTPATLHLKTPLIIYVANICFTGAMMFWLWDYVGARANTLCSDSLDKAMVHKAKIRAAIVASVFALTIPVAFIDPYAARYVPLLIPVLARVVNRRSTRRLESA